VPAFTFTATADAPATLGATPVFVDVDAESFAMDPGSLARAIDDARARGLRPKAVMPVDLYGLPADYPALSEVAEAAPERPVVIADAAQSFGGEAGGRPVGALAPITCLSFYPTKPLGGLGDGGAILTDDEDRAALWRSMRNCGRGPDGRQHARFGPTSRLDTLQAAALLVKLDAFDAELARKREIADEYSASLSGRLGVPREPAGRRSAWALYTIRTGRRDALAAALAAARIGAATYYPAPLPRHPAFARFAPPPGAIPTAERLAAEVLSLPMHADLTDAERASVCETARAAA
jgi:dTDP-4-amino-4,6-dideoxygalactose transaminase